MEPLLARRAVTVMFRYTHVRLAQRVMITESAWSPARRQPPIRFAHRDRLAVTLRLRFAAIHRSHRLPGVERNAVANKRADASSNTALTPPGWRLRAQ